MRALAALASIIALATGCPNPPGNGDCSSDGQCGGDICARDGECLPASDLTTVKVVWTIRGAAANATTCMPAPNFYINFSAPGIRSFGFAPVPCNQGQFFVDKMPRGFTEVELGADGHFDQFAPITTGGASGATAMFDLFL